MPKFAYLLILVSLLCQCKSKEMRINSSVQTYVNNIPAKDDCHYPRKMIRTIEVGIGMISLIGEEIVIEAEDGNRYHICALPTNYPKDNIKVKFSGDKLEIFMNERLVGIPLRLKEISVIK